LASIPGIFESFPTKSTIPMMTHDPDQFEHRSANSPALIPFALGRPAASANSVY
jgi:hypothetical protein